MNIGLTLHAVTSGDVFEAARECEASVFLDAYDNSRDQLEQEYGPYDASSIFLALTEPGGDAVACMRLITPSPVGLKTLVDTGRPPWFVDGTRSARAAGLDIERTWDVATLAFRRGTGADLLAPVALYHALFHAARMNDIRWIVMILDTRVRRLLNGLHIDTRLLPGCKPGPYLGSASSAPLWGDVVGIGDGMRAEYPETHRLVIQGSGLDGIAVPPAAAYRLQRTIAADGAHAQLSFATPGTDDVAMADTASHTSSGGTGRPRW